MDYARENGYSNQCLYRLKAKKAKFHKDIIKVELLG